MIHTWADIALIFLIILSMIAWAVPLTLLFFSVKGMQGAHKKAGSLMPSVQQRARQVTDIMERSGHRIARPLIRAHAWWAGVQATVHILRGGPASPPSPHASHNNEVKP
jgi:hypothetical protein